VSQELAAGAWKVIVEGRESGTVGIYDAHGAVQGELADALVAALGVASLVFEALQKSQQVWLIVQRFLQAVAQPEGMADCWGAYTRHLDLEGKSLGKRHMQQTCLGSCRSHSLADARGELYGRPGELTGTVYTCGAYCPWERFLDLRHGGSKPASKGL
jgi:hypothetical protein